MTGSYFFWTSGRGKSEFVTRKRIIVVESEQLLSAGIFSLLSANGQLDVVGMMTIDENFFDVFERVKPHIIILDEDTLSRNMTAYMLFTKNYPRLRTIVLSLGTNNVQVCDKQVVHIQNIDDFMNQIGVSNRRLNAE
jgi:chemotaxis response regulator CheB